MTQNIGRQTRVEDELVPSWSFICHKAALSGVLNTIAGEE
jgi:hypothetical protein